MTYNIKLLYIKRESRERERERELEKFIVAVNQVYGARPVHK